MAGKKPPPAVDEPKKGLIATLQAISASMPPPSKPIPPKKFKLGSLGKQHWHDLSDYVVHFAKGDSGYDTMISILWHQVLRRGQQPFGCAVKQKGLDLETQRAVCFSEAPLGFLDRLVERRGTRYGIAFSKQFILKKGGAPLWYLQLGTPQQKLIAGIMKQASKPFDADHPIWQLTPFIDFPSGQPFQYDFRWEREWRVADNVRFAVDDVAFLFLPEENHGAARGFFENAYNENIGPAYFCPYIDPLWKVDKVAEVLEEHAQATKAQHKKKMAAWKKTTLAKAKALLPPPTG